MANSVKDLSDAQLEYLYQDSLGGIKQKQEENFYFDEDLSPESDRYNTVNDYDYYKGNTGNKKVPGLESAGWNLISSDYKDIDSGIYPKDGGEGYGDIGDMFKRVQDEYNARNSSNDDDEDENITDIGPDRDDMEGAAPATQAAIDYANRYEDQLSYAGTLAFARGDAADEFRRKQAELLGSTRESSESLDNYLEYLDAGGSIYDGLGNSERRLTFSDNNNPGSGLGYENNPNQYMSDSKLRLASSLRPGNGRRSGVPR